MPTVPRANPIALLGRHWRHGLTLDDRILAHELFEPRLRENERNAERLISRIPHADLNVARNVDRRSGAHARFTAAECRDPIATMDEENLVRHQMAVCLDVRARREVLIPHHEIGRAPILTVDFEYERSFAGVAANAALSFIGLEDQPRSARRRLFE